MKPSYAPDNTRSSIIVIVLLAAGVTMVALLFGLSDKPEIGAIGVAVTSDEIAAATESATTATDAADSPAPVPTLGTTTIVNPDPDDQSASDDESATAADALEPGDVVRATAIPIPTATPAPTPEIASAVDTTPIDDAAADEPVAAAPLVSGGTIVGEFFTRAEEDAGATINRNELTLVLTDDGGGTFAGVLDMVLVDSTTVVMAMSGPIRWSTETPQIESVVAGSFTLDSPIDADDLSAADATLTITSLTSGSGALCPDSCYGFRFPEQSGF